MRICRLFLLLLTLCLYIKTQGQGFTRVYITQSEMLINGCHNGDETGKIVMFVDPETTPRLTFRYTTGEDNWQWHRVNEYRQTNINSRVFTLKLSGENEGCSGSGLAASVPVNVSAPTIIPLKKNTTYNRLGGETTSGRNRGYYLHYQTCFFPDKPQLKITSSSGSILSGGSIKVMPSEQLTLSATTADMNDISVDGNNLRYEYYYSEYGTWQEENPDWTRWKSNYDYAKRDMEYCANSYNAHYAHSGRTFQCMGGEFSSSSISGTVESYHVDMFVRQYLFEQYGYLSEPERYITKTGYKPWRMMLGNVFDCSTSTASQVKFKVRLQGTDEFIESVDSPIFTIAKPTLQVNKTNICFVDTIRLSVNMGQYSAVPNPVTYNYQYKIKNGSWKSLKETSSPTHTFRLDSLSDLIKHVGPVDFRVKVANEESAFISTDLKHRPPVQRDILLQHSCPEMNKGYVAFELPDTLRKGDITVRYRMNNSGKEDGNALPDDAFGSGWSELPTTALGPFELTVGNNYQFLFSYLDPLKSFCEYTVPDNISVQKLTPLAITNVTPQRVECFNHATGSATISIGKDVLHQKLRYKLERLTGDGLPFTKIENTVTVPENSTSFTFNNLPYGSYQFSIEYLTINSCNPITTTFDITQPDPLRFTGSRLTDVTCSTINDGSIKVFTSGGSDIIRYQLFKLDNNISTLPPIKDYTVSKSLAPIGLWLKRSDEFLTDSLYAGRYVVRIEEKCSTNFITDTFTINPVVPLQIHRNSWTTDSLTCWLDTTGYIDVIASGGINSYEWTLQSITPDSLKYHYTQPASRESLRTTVHFTDLPANVYQIRLSNQPRTLPTEFLCPDFTVDTIEIKQHRKINISNHLQHIGCKGENTGQIDLTVVGGVPYGDGTYKYAWISDGKPAGETITITDLKVGVYSVTVSDMLGCPMLDTFELKEPLQMMNKTIAAVTQDVVCYGDSAIISQQPQFGWGQYNYLWQSLDNNTIDGIHRELYVKDSMIYPTEAGRYRYSVIDSALNNSNICVSYADTFTVTLPSTPLYMHANKQTLPNGLDVSCRGVKDGFILFDLSGGNSASENKLFNVYKYQRYTLNSQWLDGNELMIDTFERAEDFISPNYIPFIHYRKTNYQGGRWKIWLEDQRGCKTKDTIIELLTPASEIHFNLHQLVHNVCYGDSVGKIAFAPFGGESPYRMQYSTEEWLETFSFDSLRSEKHSFNLRDSVGCVTDTVVEIKNLHRPITITETIFDVRCYDGNDGQYHFSADGDFPFVQYLWNSTAITDTAVKELKAGNYKLRITDNQNCQFAHDIQVKQPEKLLLSTFSKPVCSNQPLGYITANVQGGVKPYLYRFANADQYQMDSLLYNVSGNYQVEVVDAHNCRMLSDFTQIDVNTIQPSPAFMVSTFNLLGDTLMLVEVSQPAPDSVLWDIDPTVESYTVGEMPHVVLREEGSVSVRMTVFYGGCDFMLEKNIMAYTNDSLVIDWRKGAVETADPITSFTVSPNPSQGTLRIESTLSEELPSSVKIYDMQGRVVLEENFLPQVNINEQITLAAPKTQNYYLFYFTQGGHRSALIYVTP